VGGGASGAGGFTPFREAFATAGMVDSSAAQMNMAYEEAAREAGRSFARYWRETAEPREVERVLSEHEPGNWRVPAEVDRALLSAAENDLGFLWEQPMLKAGVRSGFWEVLEGRA
jgi:hypothetical protein